MKLWVLLGVGLVGCGQTGENDAATTGTGEVGATLSGSTAGVTTGTSAGTQGDDAATGASVATGAGSGGTAGAGGTTATGDASSVATGVTNGTGGASAGGTGGLGEAGASSSGGDPNLPGFDDLIVRSTVMDDYEGLDVSVAFDHNVEVDSRSEDRSAVVTSGAFEVRWRRGFDRDSFGAYVLLYVDVDGDGSCGDAADEAWWFFVSNDASEGEPVIADFDPGPNSSTIGLETITCARFESGL